MFGFIFQAQAARSQTEFQRVQAQQHKIQARIRANQIIDNERRYAFVGKYPTLKVGPWTIPTTPILPEIEIYSGMSPNGLTTRW
jgi:hypothetical protein